MAKKKVTKKVSKKKVTKKVSKKKVAKKVSTKKHARNKSNRSSKKTSIGSTSRSQSIDKGSIVSEELEEGAVISSRVLKSLGSCTECGAMITDADLEEGKKTIVNCYRCKARMRVNQLADASLKKKKYTRNVRAFGYDLSQEASTESVDALPEEFKGLTVIDEDEYDN